MAEHQDKFRQHLRKQGQMKAFKNRRQELTDEGLTPSQSWTKAALEFGYIPAQSSRKNPPVPTEPPVVYAKMRDERCDYLVRRLENMPLGAFADQLPEAVSFTLANLHRIGDSQDISSWRIDPSDAPSLEAWNLLMSVAASDGNRASFMRTVLRTMLATKAKDHKTTDTTDGDDDDDLHQAIRRWGLPDPYSSPAP